MLRVLAWVMVIVALPGCVTSSVSSPSKLIDRTVLFYEESHGNQIEYFDSSGGCFLWYPRNKAVLTGQWKADGEKICFIYGENTLNPVTGSRGDRWQCMSFSRWSEGIVDLQQGDVFGLSNTKTAPYRLRAKPRFEAVSKVAPEASP